jgi:hypothetical protein
MRGKTIQVFLTDGTPRGIKLAEITSNIEQAVFIPRNKMNEAANRPEVIRPGVYFLFGDSEGTSKPVVYIGQSRNCLERIRTHDQKKDFWNYAVLIMSKTESFTQTHIEYLEQLAISKAYDANRYSLENGVNPKKFKVPETLEADLLDNFDTIKILLSTLGFTLFESIKKQTAKTEHFFCKGKKALAEGEYQDDGFVVYKGSRANIKLTPTASSTVFNLRESLIDTNVIKLEGEVYVFQDDHLFSSPSAAASQVLGRNANGWIEWKNKSGKTLDELKRK